MRKVYIDIENLIKKKNVSKRKVCDNCDLQRTQLNSYCKNKVGSMDFEVIARICDYLECEVGALLKLK